MRSWLPPILVVAFVLRAWGLDFSLDARDPRLAVLNAQVDEQGMVGSVLEGLRDLDLHPGDFLHRGAGGYYVLGAVDAAYCALRAAREPGGWDVVLDELEANPSPLHALHRRVALVAGLLTVLVLHRLCRRELGEAEGLLAAALLATSYLHVRESHFGTVDTLWALFTLLTVGALLRLARHPSRGAYLRVGLLAGATAAIKYFGALLVLPVLVTHVWARRRARDEERPLPGATALAIAAGAGVAGFLLLSPYLFVAPLDLVEQVQLSVSRIGNEPSLAAFGNALRHHAHYSLMVGLGEPVLLLAVVGIGVALGQARGAALLFALYALLTVPTVLVTSHHPVRFALALAVLLVPPAAWALAAATRVLPRPVAVLVVALVLAPSTLRSLAFDSLVARRDTRADLMLVLAALDAPREDVVAFGWHGLPRASGALDRPYVDYYRRAFARASLDPEQLAAEPPRYVLHDESSDDGLGWDEVRPFVEDRYRLLLRLDGRLEPGVPELPDRAAGTPHLFVPFGAPWAMARPGPPLALYVRVDA